MPDLTLRSITMVMVDTVGSTELTERLGQDRGDRLVLAQLERLGEVVVSHGGFVMPRNLGDGLLAGFPSATDALDAAAGMHRPLAAFNEERRLGDRLAIRVAIAASDALVSGDDVRGVAPTLATRVEKLVPSGQTMCTEVVRLLAHGRGAFQFEPAGTHELKGFDEPVQLYRVLAPVADLVGMPASLDSTRRFEFVGRQVETQRLTAAWRSATAGNGSIVLVAGEAGVGKTRLCRELARQARRDGAVVLHGRCTEHAGEPYAPFAQMLRSLLARVGDVPTLLGAGAGELTRIVPEIAALTGVPAPSDIDVATDRYRLFQAVVGWIHTLSAGASLLLVIDDLSWADEASVQMLCHIAEHVATEHVLIVASYRPGDTHPPVRAVLRLGSGVVARVHVRGLADSEAVAFAASVLGEGLDRSGQDVMIRVGHHVGGNPLYLGETVPTLVEHGALARDPVAGCWVAGPSPSFPITQAVDDLVRERIERLSPECQRVLRTAAVIGARFPTEVLLDVVEMAPLAVMDALDEADAADLTTCEASAETYEFTHALIRQAIYDGISPSRRAAEHRRIGEAVERLYDGRLDGWYELLAHHFEHGIGALDAERAVRYLRAAGASAMRRLAHDHAVDFYQRARSIADRAGAATEVHCDLLIELGTAQRRSGSDASRRTLSAGCELALELGDAIRATAAVLGLGRGIFSITGSVDRDRVKLIDRTLGLVGHDRHAERARLLATLSSELAFDEDPVAAKAASDEALAIARRVGNPGLLVTVLGNRLVALWRVEFVDERLTLAAELEEICHLAGDNRRGKFLSAMTMCCQVAMEAGDFATADRLLQWIDETARELHQPTSMAYAKLRLASRATIAGRLDEAERLADEAYELSARAGQPEAEVFHTGQLFVIRLHQGRTDEIVDALALAAKSFPGIPAFAAAEAACAGEIGDLERCRRVIDPVLADVPTLRRDLNWLSTLCLAATAVHHLGDVDAASSLRPRIEPYRDLFVDIASAFFGSAHHYHALLSVVLGDDDAAAASFAAALEAHTALRSPPWLARTHCDFAALLAGRDPAAAARHARAAQDLGRQWGLMGIVEHARVLVTAPARPPDVPGSTAP